MTLEDFAAEMDRCSQCSYCKWIPYDQVKSWRFAKNCPSVAYYNFNSYSARGRYAIGRSLLTKQSGYSDSVREVVFTCLACGSCDVSCKVCRYNLEPLEMVRELKAKLVEDGQYLPAHQEIIESLNKHGNTLGSPRSDRGRWADGLDLPRAGSKETEILFHAGCRFSLDEQQQRSAKAAVSLLRNAGVNIAIFGGDEMCCGGRLYSMGYREVFTRYAKANIAAWKKSGVRVVVTSCADCYHAFKRLYPKLGSQITVFHTVEYIDRLIQEGRIKFSQDLPITVTYHDPCHLGRQGEPYIPWQGVEKKIKGQIVVYEPNKPRYNGAWGVYDSPRRILNNLPGLKFVEMERIREYSWCCGAGGGVREAYPEFSQWSASERIAEAMATGAETLVTACPWCEKNFGEAVKTLGDPLKVYDIIDLVQQAI